MMLGLESFDLITSAIHLSDASGIELLKEIRNNGDKHRDVPFLVISSDKEEKYLEDLKTFSGNGFLTKPFSQKQINDLAKKALNFLDEPPEETAEASKEDSTTPEIVVPEKITEHFAKSTVEAMEQYMADANLQELKDDWKLNGFFSSWVDLVDAEKRVELNLIINFPKKMASEIYEGIFGEVDVDAVAGVVQELVNIIGGIVKPKIADYTEEIVNIAYQGKDVPEVSGSLNLDLGLPESKMGEDHELDIDMAGLPQFVLPFESKEETFYLVVLFQKF